MSLLEVRQLSKRYGDKPLIQDIHLRVNEGDIIFLTGDNGSGKTTLLRLLAGLLPPDRCDYFSFAGDTAARPPHAVYLHQSPYLFSGSVRRNVEYGLRRCRLPLAAADEAMAWAGVEHLADAVPAHLSGGERRRVALARVRALHPRLYLLDEPTAHLDNDGRGRVLTLMTTLQKENATVIVSGHDRLSATTRDWRLENGKLSEN